MIGTPASAGQTGCWNNPPVETGESKKVLLSAQGLVKTYRHGRVVQAVQGVSLRLVAAEVLAFLGPNGAGKSTCIKMLAGLVEPDGGEIEVLGQRLARNPGIKREIGVVLEGNRNLYWRMTPLENLIYFGRLRGIGYKEARRRSIELLERLDLSEKRNSLVQQLSRGMQQKVAIAAALVHNPRILLLDEPALGLDVVGAESLKRILRELTAEGRAVLIATHQLDIAEALANKVVVLNKGCLVADAKLNELIARFSREVFEIEVGETLSPEVTSKLEAAGALVEQQIISAPGEFADIWPVLALVKDLRVTRVERARASLSGVYLKLLGGEDVSARP
jgi:ABC-2 type transport system ATP-binding protein